MKLLKKHFLSLFYSFYLFYSDKFGGHQNQDHNSCFMNGGDWGLWGMNDFISGISWTWTQKVWLQTRYSFPCMTLTPHVAAFLKKDFPKRRFELGLEGEARDGQCEKTGHSRRPEKLDQSHRTDTACKTGVQPGCGGWFHGGTKWRELGQVEVGWSQEV